MQKSEAEVKIKTKKWKNVYQTMTHEIEEGQDGLYSICVFNAESYSDDEITEIFGKFGYLAKMNRVNNITFLRYQTLEEATLCYETMQGDARFTVRPGKKKGGSNNVPGRDETCLELIFIPEISDFQHLKEIVGAVLEIRVASTHLGTDASKQENLRFRDGKVGEMNRNDTNRGRRPETGGGGDFGRPARQPPPKLIPFPSVVAKEEGASRPPPSAKVVVIGNLNPKMGQNNVYALCAKVKAPPLHVAMKSLKRPPYPNISYAFVYVRNEEEVNSIITSFNHLKLNGYKLVVSAAEKLSEEGKALLSAK